MTPREAIEAADAIGWDRAMEIVGPGGLSGASVASLVRLVNAARWIEAARDATR